MAAVAPIRLADYTPWPFALKEIELDVDLRSDHALVTNTMRLEPLVEGQPLELRGVELQLEHLTVDGQLLPAEAWRQLDDGLIIESPPQEPFTLTSRCRIDPYNNTSLEGLYASGGMLTTQCEAEGFRRITFHPDRPDVLACWRVRIEADQATSPVLLSNGNLVESQVLPNGRHAVIWMDPHPKPSYLFALVAGDLCEVRDRFTTAEGREVTLRLHVEAGDEPYTDHAMASLKRAMLWDERVYGLAYDLDEYNIVAVRHFNMGAMENKSLNIFNSKLVLADEVTATDGELERIESVIAHEYFHNWTGNRITCRDWFQLSLKEGLTVFRDQCFTADLHSAAVKRIEDVSMLRNTQFREDSGPTAHPVKPSEYQAIDNFYTTTIYEKGAEVIRMLQTLLGRERFMQGMATYINRFDGTAATTEDFVHAIIDGACADGQLLGFDPAQFRRWYHQAGTPELQVDRSWNPTTGELTLHFHQATAPTPGQPQKPPLVLPVSLALIGPEGREGEEHLLVMDQDHATLSLTVSPAEQPPAVSVLRGFSAPVRLRMEASLSETLQLLARDDDAFCRWDAAQRLFRQVLLARAAGRIDEEVEPALIAAIAQRLEAVDQSNASELATLLAFPGMAELEVMQAPVDPLALFDAVLALRRALGQQLQLQLEHCLIRCRSGWIQPWPEGQGDRQLTAVAWSWLAAAGHREARQQAVEAVSGPSMTLARAALRALHPIDCDERVQASSAFYQRWQDKPVILDTWFGLEASMPRADGLDQVKRLLDHPRFDPLAPNALRAVLGGFAANVPVFHAADGSGYLFLAQQIVEVDQRNPVTASRMVKVFSRWSSYGPERQEVMQRAIALLSSSTLSSNTREVVAMLEAS